MLMRDADGGRTGFHTTIRTIELPRYRSADRLDEVGASACHESAVARGGARPARAAARGRCVGAAALATAVHTRAAVRPHRATAAGEMVSMRGVIELRAKTNM